MMFVVQTSSVRTFALGLCLVQVAVVAGSKCISRDQNRTLLLNNLNSLEGTTFDVSDSQFKYSLGVCSQVSPHLSNVSVIRSPLKSDSKDPTYVLGRFNDSDIVVGDRWLLLTYGGGDVIAAPGPCNGTRWKTLVLFSCRAETRKILVDLVDPLNLVCATVFHVTTSLVCPATGHSGWTIFFMMLLTAALCYLIIGMAYRRFVTGAKGFEQIPNYNFWRNPCAYVQERMESRDPSRGRNQPWSQPADGGASRGGSGDPADEPLLHP